MNPYPSVRRSSVTIRGIFDLQQYISYRHTRMLLTMVVPRYVSAKLHQAKCRGSWVVRC